MEAMIAAYSSAARTSMGQMLTASPAARFAALAKSPLPGVSALSWYRFAEALEVQPAEAISPSGGYGAFAMRPQRLIELGYAQRGPRVVRDGRRVLTCVFTAPFTEARFLGSRLCQHKALALSMQFYAQDLEAGKIARPEGVSLAGVLSILHRGGRGALKGWPELFSDTRAVYERAKGAF